MQIPLKDREAWLKVLALVLIGVAAGPEIGLAMEMTTLLEILGAVAFFLSFRVGARMLLEDLVTALRNYIFPPFLAHVAFPRVIAYAFPRAGWVVGFSCVFYLFGTELHAGALW